MAVEERGGSVKDLAGRQKWLVGRTLKIWRWGVTTRRITISRL